MRATGVRDGPGADAEEEDRRRGERKTLTNERSHVNRVKGLLFAQGVSGYEPLRRDRRKRLEELTTGDGRPLPAHLKAQIGRELDRLELLLEQIKAVTSTDNAAQPERHRAGVCRCLVVGGAVTHFDNRRQVAAYAGLAPTPWQSGSVDYDQGVSKAGNPRLRTTLVQTAWLWLRHQPRSALTLWFKDRVKQNSGRLTTIIALARKLLVALWKYVNAGVVIEGGSHKDRLTHYLNRVL